MLLSFFCDKALFCKRVSTALHEYTICTLCSIAYYNVLIVNANKNKFHSRQKEQKFALVFCELTVLVEEKNTKPEQKRIEKVFLWKVHEGIAIINE